MLPSQLFTNERIYRVVPNVFLVCFLSNSIVFGCFFFVISGEMISHGEEICAVTECINFSSYPVIGVRGVSCVNHNVDSLK